jgi:hypothetical protein
MIAKQSRSHTPSFYQRTSLHLPEVWSLQTLKNSKKGIASLDN